MAKYNGKNSLLPPKSPFPSKPTSYVDYIPSSKPLSKARDGNTKHQRTSSESCLIEEQPSWLDELLDEPDTPVQRGGHRRSSSDSFAYTDFTNAGSMNYITRDGNQYNKITPVSSWESQDFVLYMGNNVKLFSTSKDTDRNPSLLIEKHEVAPKSSTEKKDSSHPKLSETETKRAKQYVNSSLCDFVKIEVN